MATATVHVPGVGDVTYEYDEVTNAAGATTPQIRSVQMNGQEVSERDFTDAVQYITGKK